ncbi:hypothetical protein JN531_012685 [Flagellatimonas centrodinii]|uniref:hypothetical protein n=1 Tax=Flagellatimonas centrodinii TaxID=2806210 RepID=UPI001FF8F6D7|nr:hypothetical protein [Flagellatimonas centrodinii]ULQ45956.1 hypothetical protein JN531_012685 [Flagellatimonas centrodinii]
MLTISRDLAGPALREIEAFEKQQRFAERLALTRLSIEVQKAEQVAIATVFDRPSSFTQRSVLTFARQEAGGNGFVRVVKIRDQASGGTAPDRYLAPQVHGGERSAKRFERAFRFVDFRNNAFRDDQLFAVPGKGARLNRYGNLSQGTYQRILSALRMHSDDAFNSSARSRRRNKKLPQYFLGKAGKGRRTLAIWERHGRGQRSIKPVLIAVEKTNYRKRFPFFDIGAQVMRGRHNEVHAAALDEALRTARSGR